MAETDWRTWHESYSDSTSLLAQRLGVVQGFVEAFLDSRHEALQVVSLCAGTGLDLLDVLARHPNRSRVSARLVELDSTLAASARQRAEATGLTGVEVIVGDASSTDAFVGAVPADLVLACGVFGNASDGDVRRTVRAMPELCAERGVVIWTRHTWPPDLTPQIRRWFSEAGFGELRFSSPGPESYSVGMHELRARPRPLLPHKRLFTFIDPLTRPPSQRAIPRSPSASGDAAREEEDYPAERRHEGEDEQPFDDDDRKHDAEHDERGQQEQNEEHGVRVPEVPAV